MSNDRPLLAKGRLAAAKRMRVQLPAVAAAAFLIPLIIPYATGGLLALSLPNTWNSQVASLLAAVIALVAFRRLTVYPGAQGSAYLMPAFSTCFGVATVLLLVTRLAYSGTMMLTGYIASFATLFGLWYVGQRRTAERMYVVPAGNTQALMTIPRVEWLPLTSPQLELPEIAIVADLHHDHGNEWERMLARAALEGRPVYHTKQLAESLTGRVEIDHLGENSLGSLLPNLAYRGVKRLSDLVAALILLPVLLVPMIVVAVLIRLDSRGPALFRQRRMGYRGVAFTVVKFRTMSYAPEAQSDEVAAITHDGDARVTRIGRFLRRSRIDELPQILNVIRGEMSWIGPRPEALPLSNWYERELPFYSYRHIVRPGISGWAQVNQGHVAELHDVHIKLHYDFYYIKHFSAWLDMLIALRTAVIMATGFGAR